MEHRAESFLDRTFRKYGEEDFGKEMMDTVPTEKLVEYRCEAFKALGDMTKQFGIQEKGTLEALFYFILLEHFKNEGVAID